MDIDLAGMRQAREEARNEPQVLRIGTDSFRLVDELPLELGSAIREQDWVEVQRLLLADPEADLERLRSHRLSLPDIDVITDAYMPGGSGESSASSSRSKSGGTGTRRPSKSSTGSTSAKLASAKKK